MSESRIFEQEFHLSRYLLRFLLSPDRRNDNIISYSFLVDGRGDEEFEQLLEKHAVDEIEAKPKNFYSKFCNRWMSICGVSTKK